MLRLSVPALLLLVVAVSSCSGPVVATATVDHTFTTTRAPHVIARSFNGRIDVVVGSDIEVVATAKKTAHGWSDADAQRQLKGVVVTFTQDGDTVTVSADKPSLSLDIGTGAAFTLTVPAGATLDLSTSNGDLTALGTEAAIVADTSNGNIELTAGAGSVKASTSNGRVQVTPFDAATVTASSSNGDVEFHGALLDGSSTFETSNGDVDLFVPSDSAFHLDADTSNGTVTCTLPMVVTRSERDELHADVGTNPAATMRASSSNGNVRVSRL